MRLVRETEGPIEKPSRLKINEIAHDKSTDLFLFLYSPRLLAEYTRAFVRGRRIPSKMRAGLS